MSKFGASLSVDHTGTSYDENEDLTKVFLGQTKGTSETQNSGSTNKTQGTVTGTTQNSGSTNHIITGKSSSTTTNSGHVDTSQLMLTDQAVQHIANQLLESNQGLAATVKGQNASGAYNTTTQGLLASDLISRISGEVAARGAKTVTKVGGSSSTTENSGQDVTQIIGGSTSTNESITDMTNLIGASSAITNTTSNTQTDEHDIKESVGSKDTTEVKGEAHGGWILCTEFAKQRRLPVKYYRYGAAAFAKYDDQGKKGYYIWAEPALIHVRKHPYSLLSKFLCSVMNARAQQLAADGGCEGAKKTLYGLVAKQLYAVCWILSRTVARNYIPFSSASNTSQSQGDNHAIHKTT